MILAGKANVDKNSLMGSFRLSYVKPDETCVTAVHHPSLYCITRHQPNQAGIAYSLLSWTVRAATGTCPYEPLAESSIVGRGFGQAIAIPGEVAFRDRFNDSKILSRKALVASLGLIPRTVWPFYR